MPYADPEKAREYRRRYYVEYRKGPKHKACAEKYRARRKELNKRQYVDNREECIIAARRYNAENADAIIERKRQLKTEIFNAYGGVLCCRCGEFRISALTIDHEAQDGAERRRNGQPQGVALYRQLRRDGFPVGYRVLCFNCNILAWLEHIEIGLSKNKRAVASRKIRRRFKIEFMKAIGGACVECGIDDIRLLTVHHIDHNGAEHRRRLGGRSGYQFYHHILNTRSFDGLECRCFSCNMVARSRRGNR